MKNNFFSKIEEYLIAIGIIIMVVMESLNVVFNKIFPANTGLLEEVAIFSYIWVCFLCASFCTKKCANIIVDVFTSKYNKNIRYSLNILEYLSDALLSIMFIYGSVLFIMQTKISGKTGMTGVPLWIIYLAPLIGFSLNLVRDIQQLISVLKNKK
ncbi:TRAP transporter small permease [uncultured Brachyspira sp.]|uniref:TRAP transporter small permease n=1 Tax=uncultured Brachyspira sp. TaxID=221953 RepID=UPI0025D96EE7|nr:TRAP transporter small permease [uncultured Brachyspira sp.]